MDNVRSFQKECFAKYLTDIRSEVSVIPEEYVYPDGNPIRPVLPIQKAPCHTMIISAFPSARLENRHGVLIPIADDLAPFAEQLYFDGVRVRPQTSREALNEDYFPQLGIKPEEIWITDLVKIFLMSEDHCENCLQIAPQRTFVNTRDHFKEIAKCPGNIKWISREIEVCNPKLIITLGEVPARVLTADEKTDNKLLLDGNINEKPVLGEKRSIAHLAHPEICRRNNDWKMRTQEAISRLAEQKREMMEKTN